MTLKRTLLATAMALALVAPTAAMAAYTVSPMVQVLPYSVASIQQALNDLGYAAGPADGVVGPRTRAAIHAYQVDHGLPPSGQPSLPLFDHLHDTWAAHMGFAVPVTPGPAMTQMVSDIQTQLRMRGYDIPVVSGVVDMRTTEAIRAYQADAGLPITGMASATLLAHLQLGTSPGMTQDEIVRLKAALSARGYDPGPHDGVVGPRLRDAIRTYQADAGVPVTGEPSASLVAQLEAGTSVDLTPAEVLRLKAALSARGYDPGPHDSLDGPELRAAIRDYQADARLPVTGEPSASLIADLEAGAQPAELVVEVDDTAWLTELEGALQNRRYYVGEVDGVIDDRTRTAISAYQRDAGLPITGEPSTELLIQLRSSPVQNIGGTASSIVWQIENELHNRGFAVGPIDGTVDQQTELAIVSFQRHAGIQRTGKADYALLQHLEMFQSVRNNGQEVSLVVWRIEDELSRRGYVTGPVDGSIDESTVQAIEAYQHDQGLRVTGEADTQLLGYIEGSSLRRISQR